MNRKLYTEDQLQNLELQQASDQLDDVMEKFLKAVDQFIDNHKYNVQFVQDTLNSIAYGLQKNQPNRNYRS